MASLTLKNVKKIYPYSGDDAKKKKKGEPVKKTNLQITDKGVVAVQEFNLEIADKEFIVLVGPSGCGKSTTLRMIAGLEEISEGELYIGDRLVNDVAPKDRDIAMVFQNYALYPHMTVYDNMAFALKLRHTPKDEIDKAVKQAAEILDITQYLGRKPKALSGGQRQRVAIGRAIVRSPQVMLMDEPLSNLDAKLRNQMRAEIIKLRERINTTFIYVTHDQTEAMTLGDRIVIMKDGFIQQIGTPQEVFNHPYNLFVATFIGTPQMNMFENAKLVITGYEAGDNDLVFASPTEVTADNQISTNNDISLTFKHLLSKVKFTFTSGFPKNYKMVISDLKINIPNKATYTEGSGWGTASANADKSFTINPINEEYNGTTLTQSSGEKYVIPQNNNTLKVTFKVTVTDNGSYSKEATLEASLASGDLTSGNAGNNTWTAGYAYNYKTTIEESNVDTDLKPIRFNVDSSNGVDGWTDASNDGIDTTLKTAQQ